MYRKIVPVGRLARVDEFVRFNTLPVEAVSEVVIPIDERESDYPRSISRDGRIVTAGRIIPLRVI